MSKQVKEERSKVDPKIMEQIIIQQKRNDEVKKCTIEIDDILKKYNCRIEEVRQTMILPN